MSRKFQVLLVDVADVLPLYRCNCSSVFANRSCNGCVNLLQLEILKMLALFVFHCKLLYNEPFEKSNFC